MLKSKTFVKKTRKGNVLKVTREHYLRDDVGCGVNGCILCRMKSTDVILDSSPASNSKRCPFPHYILPDTNIILRQIDFLEDPVIENVIILQIVLQEVKHQNPGIYKRLRDIIASKSRKFYVFSNEHHKQTFVSQRIEESTNDRNDRAIRVSVEWYNQHLLAQKQEILSSRVILLTNDRDNRQKAMSCGIEAYTILEYVHSLINAPHLLDRLAQEEDSDIGLDNGNKKLYPEHLGLSVIQTGLKSGKYLQGTFQASRENRLEGFVNVYSMEKWIIVQSSDSLNRAVHEDIVAVELLPESQWTCPSDVVINEDTKLLALNGDEEDTEALMDTLPITTATRVVDKSLLRPTGRIIGIIKRNWRQYCGTILPLQNMSGLHHTFVPADKRIPRIRINTRQGEWLRGKRIIVSIDSWPRSSRLPRGHFVRDVGMIGDKETENEVLLLEHDVPHLPFAPAVLKDLPSLPWFISDHELQVRKDLRHIPICSVDPPGCTDIDDALHYRELDNGNYEVGVHIADVTHFIRPGTALDEEAANRGTTVYLADKRIDMVPGLLSSNLCSLRGGEERLAFSCLWELTPNADIVTTVFCKSIIKSRMAFTYQEAQMRIDDRTQTDDVTIGLRGLNRLAKLLKQRRIDAGALTLASPEVRFEIDSETHDPIDLTTKELKETNSLVEEFMLLANISVAKQIYEIFPNCALLRRHPSPPLSNYDILLKAANAKGVVLGIETAKDLAVSLDLAHIKGDPYFNTMLRILATRCMMQALYFSSGTLPYEEFQHYGLASSIYTHFTSPIRRYSDIIVHRLLAASINADNTYPALLDKHRTQQLCNHLNHRHKMAQYAQRSSVALHTQLYFKDKGTVVDGYVLFVKRNALQIIVPTYGIETSIFFDREDNLLVVYDETKPSLTVDDVMFQLFEKVVVRIEVEKHNLQHSHLKLILVNPVIPGLSTTVDNGEVEVEEEETHKEPPLKRRRL